MKTQFPSQISLFVFLLLLFGCSNSGNFFTFRGGFDENPDGTFTIDTDGDGVPDDTAAIDTDGDGEPDTLSDGGTYTPPVSGEGDGDRETPVDDKPIPDTGDNLGGDGHHFDVDSFRNTGGNWLTDEVCHVHEFDNKSPHFNVIDFLSDCNDSGKSFGFVEAVNDCSGDLRYRLENADRASGKLELYVGGKEHQLFSDVSISKAPGASLNFNWVTHASSKAISKFKLQPNNLDVLIGTEPRNVQSDEADRDGSFTIKVFCDDSQIWEFATYEHVH